MPMLSDEDLENEENEFGSLGEDSPPEEHYGLPMSTMSMGMSMSGPTSMPQNVTSMPAMTSSGMNMGQPAYAMPMQGNHHAQMIQPQLLQQRI